MFLQLSRTRRLLSLKAKVPGFSPISLATSLVDFPSERSLIHFFSSSDISFLFSSMKSKIIHHSIQNKFILFFSLTKNSLSFSWKYGFFPLIFDLLKLGVMKDFLSDLWENMTDPIEGFWDGVGRFFLWLVMLIVVVLILWGIYYLVDSVGRPKHEGYGNISGFGHSEAYTSTTYVKSGDIMIPITTYHPESWSVFIKVGDKEGSIGISESFYNYAKSNDRVYVTYTLGRISGKLYIKDFSTIN